MKEPVHDTPILGMANRPPVSEPTEYGNAETFWVEYPNGLLDLTRSTHLPAVGGSSDAQVPPLDKAKHLEVPVDGGTIRIDKSKSAFVVVDMQNFFLHPDLRAHPKGLACVDPTLKVVHALRKQGVRIIWVNWGLTDHELKTIPPSLIRGFKIKGRGGFGAELPGGFGRLLMRDAKNSELYGPLQDAYVDGQAAGTDVWIHKNRMSGIWGHQSALDLYLQEEGITSLFFGGVNADQCVLGTLVDAYYKGYDCILVEDTVATTSPEGGYENVVFNAGNAYGFVTSSDRVERASAV